MRDFGDDVIRISFRTEQFEVAFYEFFRFIFIIVLALAEIIVIWLGGITHPAVTIIGLPLLTALLCAGAVLFLMLRFRFTVRPDGLECYDFWGLRRTAHWDAMDRVEILNFLGLRYARISSAELRNPIWLPLFIRRFDDFRELVLLYTEPHHPLREWLVAADEH